jgi:hypothetical protein
MLLWRNEMRAAGGPDRNKHGPTADRSPGRIQLCGLFTKCELIQAFEPNGDTMTNNPIQHRG